MTQIQAQPRSMPPFYAMPAFQSARVVPHYFSPVHVDGWDRAFDMLLGSGSPKSPPAGDGRQAQREAVCTFDKPSLPSPSLLV